MAIEKMQQLLIDSFRVNQLFRVLFFFDCVDCVSPFNLFCYFIDESQLVVRKNSPIRQAGDYFRQRGN